LYGKFSTSRYENVYGHLTYEVKLRRKGSEISNALGIYFNGNPWPLTTQKDWHHGYSILLNRSGRYSIQRIDDGVGTAIVNWTDCPLINNGWSNPLKVTYNKDTVCAQFFIIGTRVHHGHFHTYRWGNQGVTMGWTTTDWE